MEKAKKLKRYSRKDYTQLVDFPVEIVGRDGVIRRYSFESSVRLYQRRIASAPSRYEDSEVVRAEVQHCRMRIEQLRKSYFHRYGWAAAPADGAWPGALAGEVAAFLRRVHGDGELPEQLDVRWLGAEGEAQIHFVRSGGGGRGHLLYLYRFREHGPCDGRDAFFRFLRMLRAARGEGAEVLVAFHHTADCGLVLTGNTAVAVAPPVAEDDELHVDALDPDAPDPLDAASRALAAADPERALNLLSEALGELPFRRGVAVGVAVVADALGDAALSELAARMGAHHFPEDPVFAYHLGLARLRQGDLDGAGEGMERAATRAPGMAVARFWAGLLDLHAGRWVRARARLKQAVARARPEDADLTRAATSLVRRVELAVGALALGLLAGGVSGALALGGGHLALPAGALAGLSLGLGADLALRLRAEARPERLATLRLAPPEAVGTRRPAPGAVA